MAKRKTQSIGIAAIAQRLSVSKATVSLVMNGRAKEAGVADATAERVIRLAKELNYQPNRWARQLCRQRSNVVCVLFSDLRNDWVQDIMEGAGPVLSLADYLPLIGTHNYEYEFEKKEIEQAISRKDDGILCQPVPGHKDLYLKILKNEVPFVFVGDSLEQFPEANSVAWNCKPAARKAVEYLIDKGRRRIGFVGNKVMTASHISRYKTYSEVLERAGLQKNEDFICIAEGLVCPQFNIKKIEAMFSSKKNAPDAFFALNDSLAYPLMSALAAIGIKVPDDVAVIGMCDLPLSGDHGAGLTTIREPLQQIGRRSAEIILQLIDNPDTGPFHELIDGGELVVRRTV
jgi:LacI family transcriptional regulator